MNNIPEGAKHYFEAESSDTVIWSNDSFLYIEHGNDRIAVPLEGTVFHFLDVLWMMEEALMNDVEL